MADMRFYAVRTAFTKENIMKRITMIFLTVLMVLVLCRGSSQRRYLP